MSNEQHNKEIGEKALELMRALVQRDEELRKKYEVENKFRFIRERLKAILQQLEQTIEHKKQQMEEHAKGNELKDDEIIVYVYLYNAHGIVLSSWQNLLMPKVFYEYSVNRPIYKEKSHIEGLLHSKINKAQHGYLTMVIKASHVIQSGAVLKDSLGSPLIKIKEGSLSFGRLVSFSCNGQEYILNAKNELVKKT